MELQQYNNQFTEGDIVYDYDDGVTYLIDLDKYGQWFALVMVDGDSNCSVGDVCILPKPGAIDESGFPYPSYAQDILYNIYSIR